MISGTVNARLELTLPLKVLDATGVEQDIEAVIDTGFSGSLTLPPRLIRFLGLPFHSKEPMTLADGSATTVDLYNAEVIWHGFGRHIHVHAIGGTPLVGMRLLFENDLRAGVEDGGAVEIEET